MYNVNQGGQKIKEIPNSLFLRKSAHVEQRKHIRPHMWHPVQDDGENCVENSSKAYCLELR